MNRYSFEYLPLHTISIYWNASWASVRSLCKVNVGVILVKLLLYKTIVGTRIVGWVFKQNEMIETSIKKIETTWIA